MILLRVNIEFLDTDILQKKLMSITKIEKEIVHDEKETCTVLKKTLLFNNLGKGLFENNLHMTNLIEISE